MINTNFEIEDTRVHLNGIDKCLVIELFVSDNEVVSMSSNKKISIARQIDLEWALINRLDMM